MHLSTAELNIEGTRTGRFRSDVPQRSNTPKPGERQTDRLPNLTARCAANDEKASFDKD